MLSRSLFSLLGFALLLAFPSSLPAAGNLVDGAEADLIYNPVTGNVQIDARDETSMRITSFVIATDQDDMRPENFVENPPGNLGPFLNIGTNTDATSSQFGQTDPTSGVWSNPTDLGDIFPPGMDVLELFDYLTRADYGAHIPSGNTFDLIVVPESSGYAQMFVVLLLSGSLSRKRST